MDKQTIKREYNRRWATRELVSPRFGSATMLQKACGKNHVTLRKILRGGEFCYDGEPYEIRKMAYEMYGYGFLN